MICIVCSWSVLDGKGGGVMVWPSAGLPVRLSREAFNSRGAPKLVPGDKIAFGALSPEGVALWAAPLDPVTLTDSGEGVSRVPDPEDENGFPNRAVAMTAPVEVPPVGLFVPTPWTAPRRCILCARVFLSAGPSERLCPRCRPPAWNGA